MTSDDFIHACWQMELEGGHFVFALAKLYYVADGSNRLLLQQTFKHYFEDYRDRYNRANPQPAESPD